MKITSTTVTMESRHFSEQIRESSESLRRWSGAAGNGASAAAADQVSLSQAGVAASATNGQANAINDAFAAADNDPNLQLIRQLLRFLTGHDVRVFNAGDMSGAASAATPAADANPAAAAPATPAPATNGVGWGVDYQRSESVSETEQTAFAASGVVRTSDGREISFALSLSMSRSYEQHSSLSISAGDAPQVKDPLVINFAGSAAQLSSQRFAFDLDSDGNNENINSLAPGSGFLALDKNADGRINNGSELFGATTGNGFAELAKLDSDGNGWIDENDAAFKQLRVWSHDGSGDRLQTLRQAGVGAINLGNIDTPFSLKDSANTTLGLIRSSGVFLREDGGAGTIQQVDLTV
jgi:hypothetical protein